MNLPETDETLRRVHGGVEEASMCDGDGPFGHEVVQSGNGCFVSD